MKNRKKTIDYLSKSIYYICIWQNAIRLGAYEINKGNKGGETLVRNQNK